MAAKKTERLLNLVICLLATRRYLSVQQIREAVPGYAADSSSAGDEAFRRMFERDKQELRDLGVPLETGTDVHAHDDEPGYRISRRDYELPELTLAPDEAAAVGLAARLWQAAPLAGATGSALLKLQAAGLDITPVSGALQPRVAASEPAFASALIAVTSGRPVRFTYRGARRSEPEERTVEPWGVVSWHGRWYLVGLDTGRGETRVFRLSRVVGEVALEGRAGEVVIPVGLDLRAAVATTYDEPAASTARVRVRAGTCWELRSESVLPGGTVPAADAGWEELELGFTDPERLADRVTGFGSDAVVLSPPAAREAVVRRLSAALGAPA